MAERTLTAPEIDALLSIFRGGARSTDKEVAVEDFDVNQPSRIPRSAFDLLRIRYRRSADEMAQQISNVLGASVSMELEGLEQVVFESWRGALPTPCCAFQVEMAPLKEPAVVVLEHDLAFDAVDRLLGGSGATEVGPRALTGTEANVLQELLDHVVAAHVDVWRPYVLMSRRIRASVSIPDFLRDIPDREVVVASTYRIEGFGETSRIRFALPSAGLEPHLQHDPRPAALDGDEARARQRISDELAGVMVDLSVCLGTADIPLRDLLNLEQDDVIVLDRATQRPVELLIEGTPKFQGYLKRNGRQLVFQRVAGGDES